jgi:hypothetical protein
MSFFFTILFFFATVPVYFIQVCFQKLGIICDVIIDLVGRIPTKSAFAIYPYIRMRLMVEGVF